MRYNKLFLNFRETYADYDLEPLWSEQPVLPLIGEMNSHPKRPHKQHNAEKLEGVKKVKKWLTKNLKCEMYLGLA